MASGDIKILDSLSINQNTIGLVISYIGVVYVARLDVDNSYLYCLVNFIGCLCSILFFICTLSVISSMIVYAIEYCVKKWYRRKIVEEHMDNAEAKIDDLVKIKDIFK